MERGNTKHNARVDEQLEHETRAIEQGHGLESHTRADRLQEDGGEFDPEVRPSVRPGEDDVDPPLGVSVRTAQERSALAIAFVPSLFPATRDELLAYAESHPVPDPIVERVRSLPAGQTYENVQAVWQALGEPVEEHHTRRNDGSGQTDTSAPL